MRIRLGDVREEVAATEIWRTRIDDRTVIIDRSASGALQLRFGEDAAFRIDPDDSTVTCAPRPGAKALPWQRFLLDTVLWSAALVHERVALHAAAVADAHGAVAIVGGTGGGKTSVATALLRRGSEFVTDDILFLSPSRDAILAHPGPPVMNLDAGEHPGHGAQIGRVLADFGDEHWVSVPRFVHDAVPLRAVVILRRTTGEPGVRRYPMPQASVQLEANSVALPGMPQALARRRFEVFGEVAARVPLLELCVPPSLTPGEIADTLQLSLADPAERTEPRLVAGMVMNR